MNPDLQRKFMLLAKREFTCESPIVESVEHLLKYLRFDIRPEHKVFQPDPRKYYLFKAASCNVIARAEAIREVASGFIVLTLDFTSLNTEIWYGGNEYSLKKLKDIPLEAQDLRPGQRIGVVDYTFHKCLPCDTFSASNPKHYAKLLHRIHLIQEKEQLKQMQID